MERGGFVLTFFGLAACLVISLIGFVNDTCTRRTPDSISEGFSRWMTPHPPRDYFLTLGSAVSYTLAIMVRTGSNHTGLAAKTLTSTRGKVYLLRISSSPVNHMKPRIINSSVLKRVFHHLTSPKV